MDINPHQILSKYTVKKPPKNRDRLELIDKLSTATGRTKRSIYFSVMDFPNSWLTDALNHCLHFSDPKARNAKLTEFINLSKKI
jgi:hypothetical protein